MKTSNTDGEHIAGAAVSRMASNAHIAVDRIADATNQAADSLSDKGHEIKVMEERWLANIRNYVEHNPVQSLGIAIASGFLLSRIISNR